MKTAKKSDISKGAIDLSNMGAVEAAKALLGCELTRHLPKGEARVRIVETEAYDQADAASHSYNGRTPRTDVMFGEAGHLYVYFTYGMHYCCNIVVGHEGYGAAVLIRAVEPLDGEDLLKYNRPNKSGIELTNGPAKLCQALKIDKQLNGHDLAKSPFILTPRSITKPEIVSTIRIGISKAVDEPWRFYIRGNPYVSK